MTKKTETAHDFDEKCLHCAVNYAIGWWAKKNAPGATDAAGETSFRLNVSQVIPKISEVVAELVYKRLAEEHHAAFETYAHKCLDKAFEDQRRTAKLIGHPTAARRVQ